MAVAVGALAGYPEIRREVRYGEKSRVDFLLSGGGRPDCYVEVKNVHLMRRPGLAEFPDAATARGARHLADLAAMVAAGHRAAMLYVVQREDCRAFTLAGDIDPAYLMAYDAARAVGVEMLCYASRLSPQEIVLADALPVLSRCDVASKFDIE